MVYDNTPKNIPPRTIYSSPCTPLVHNTPIFRPNNKTADNSFTEYGCGKCPKKAKNGSCLSCPAWTGSENSNCNKWHEPIFTFHCYQNETSVKCSNGSLLNDIHCWGLVDCFFMNMIMNYNYARYILIDNQEYHLGLRSYAILILYHGKTWICK